MRSNVHLVFLVMIAVFIVLTSNTNEITATQPELISYTVTDADLLHTLITDVDHILAKLATKNTGTLRIGLTEGYLVVQSSNTHEWELPESRKQLSLPSYQHFRQYRLINFVDSR